MVLERRNVARSLEEVVNEMLKTADQQKTPKEGGGSEYYDATFYLTEVVASQLRDLMTRSKGQILLLTIAGHRFGAGRVMGPLEGNGFAPDLFDNDKANLERVLSPIRDKVRWK